jgi:hypothetical protein
LVSWVIDFEAINNGVSPAKLGLYNTEGD